MIATMIPGRGGAAVAALGDRAVLSDLYDEVGWEICRSPSRTAQRSNY